MNARGRNKGRYVLLAALALGGWWALRERAPDTNTRSAPGVSGVQAGADHRAGSSAPTCAVPPAQVMGAPPAPRALSGTLGLFVAEVDPATLAFRKVVAQDQSGVFPLASTYKQAVLWAVLREVDAGRMSLQETFTVTHASQSLGDYPFDGSDVTALARRMIHNSDNTATDLLHRRVGLDAVQAVADDLQLCNTRLILPTKDWWVAQAGLSKSFPGAAAFLAARGQERSRIAHALDQDAQQYRADTLQVSLDRYFEQRYDPAADVGTHNVSTPFELATLIAHEFLRPGLTPDSQARQRALMATGFGDKRIQVPHTFFGGKGGNGWRILTYSGYVHTRDGRDLVYVFMQHGANQTYTMHNTGAAFSWINAAIQALSP